MSEQTETALELRDALRRGEASARELVERSLARIEAGQHLGAFVSVRAELALAEADRADRLIAETAPEDRRTLPPLLGLPTAHKDLVRVRGFVTTHGSAAVPHLEAEADDPVAADVRAAGAICLGKTQVPEFGIAGYSENLIAPPARNPADPALTAGGSSGGTATAIAAGMIPAAIGSDAGGSIRIPSGACGLVGLKPGRGVVPADARSVGEAAIEVDELGAPRMSVSGPMARTVRDAALFYDAITIGSRATGNGGDPMAVTGGRGTTHSHRDEDRPEPALAAVERAHELGGLRIGISVASPFESRMPILVDTAATDALHRAARTLEAAGHALEPADFDYGEAYPDAFTTVWTQALRRIPLEPGAEGRLGELARWFLEGARAAGEERIARAVAELHRFAGETRRQWGAYDAVLTPALAFAPPATGAFWALGPEGDYRLQCEWAPQTSMVNVTGLPAIAVPVSLDERGLPRGVQLIGRAGDELRLLQLAAQLTGE